MKILLAGFLLFSSFVYCHEYLYNYCLFTNSRMDDNYFFSKTSFQSPSFLKNDNYRLPVNENIFNTPGNSLELQYVNGVGGNWVANIFREDIRGQDHFGPAKVLSFSIYCTTLESQKELPRLRLIFKDSSLSGDWTFATDFINKWTRFNLRLVPSYKDFQIPDDVIGVQFSQNGDDGNKHTIYVDDIEFLPSDIGSSITARPQLTKAEGYSKHLDITWQPISDDHVKFVKIYRSEDGKNFTPVGIQSPLVNRYADFTGVTGRRYSYKISFLNYRYKETGFSNIVSAATKTMTDEELLTMVQKACFRYYWEEAERVSGMAREDIPGRTNMIAAGASGFGIMALIVGTEREFISRQQSVGRFLKITSFLEQAEKFHGAFPHFIDGSTGKVEPFFGDRDDGGDLVETSFLMQGLLAARAYFNRSDENEKTIRERITAIWHNIEWNWYRRYPDSKYLYWHWSPDKAWIINHRLTGWNETMVTYLLAIASPTHSVPAGLYYSGWANQDSSGQQYRMNWGGTKDGSMYTNGNTYFGIKLKVGVSDGGPLFFTHYSYMGYDPHFITDKYTNYFDNNKNIALINYRYCVKNPDNYQGYGDSCWGLTACDGPITYAASEPVNGRNDGTIAPTGAVSSFPYTPVESMKALKNYYYKYGKFLWGEYGFRDAFDLTENWCSGLYMGLNQAPMVVMVENYRTGLIWKLFMGDVDVKNGLEKLNKESKK
jgi:exo beta-1,2-glucooligosaccharide sophorohydrolase (non-reducing end)